MSDQTYYNIKTKKARISHIQQQIEKDDRWLRRGIVAVYRFQTDDEQISSVTSHHNGVGFNSYDAPILTPIARALILGNELTPFQIKQARRVMKKYASQLERIAAAKCAKGE